MYTTCFILVSKSHLYVFHPVRPWLHVNHTRLHRVMFGSIILYTCRTVLERFQFVSEHQRWCTCCPSLFILFSSSWVAWERFTYAIFTCPPVLNFPSSCSSFHCKTLVKRKSVAFWDKILQLRRVFLQADQLFWCDLPCSCNKHIFKLGFD